MPPGEVKPAEEGGRRDRTMTRILVGVVFVCCAGVLAATAMSSSDDVHPYRPALAHQRFTRPPIRRPPARSHGPSQGGVVMEPNAAAHSTTVPPDPVQAAIEAGEPVTNPPANIIYGGVEVEQRRGKEFDPKKAKKFWKAVDERQAEVLAAAVHNFSSPGGRRGKHRAVTRWRNLLPINGSFVAAAVAANAEQGYTVPAPEAGIVEKHAAMCAEGLKVYGGHNGSNGSSSRDLPSDVLHSAPTSPRSTITVVFILNKIYSSRVRYTIYQALRQGFQVAIVGLGARTKVMKHHEPMMRLVVPFLEEYFQPDDIVLVADAGDVSFVQDEPRLRQQYQLVARPGTVLLSTEGELWAAPGVRRADFPRCRSQEYGQGRRGMFTPYPNTGLFIGAARDIATLLRRGLAFKQFKEEDKMDPSTLIMDQPLILYNWRRRNVTGVVTLDSYSAVFLSMFVPDSGLRYVVAEQFDKGEAPPCPELWDRCRVSVYLSRPQRPSRAGLYPALIHWNGPAKKRLSALLKHRPRYVGENCDRMYVHHAVIGVMYSDGRTDAVPVADVVRRPMPTEAECREYYSRMDDYAKEMYGV